MQYINNAGKSFCKHFVNVYLKRLNNAASVPVKDGGCIVFVCRKLQRRSDPVV